MREEVFPSIIHYSLSDGICILSLNSPPVNTITFELLDELRAAVRRPGADAGKMVGTV